MISSVLLNDSLKFQIGSCRFELHNEEKRLSKLTIESDDIKFNKYPRIEHMEGEIPNVIIPMDTFLLSLKPQVRAIRGALSLWGVHDIDVEYPKSSWQPETDEETHSTSILSAKMSRQTREDEAPREFPLDIIVRSIVSRGRLVEYEIPFEFYRRGATDIYNERYIEAIYDFYFVFEYLWGNGKFHKKEIVSQFVSIPLAVSTVEYARSKPPAQIVSNKADLDLYQDTYYKKSTEEIFEHIVELRGFLHHQSSKRKQTWNPSSDREYRVDSHFLHTAAHQAMVNIFFEIIFADSEVEKFKATKVYTKDNSLVNWIPIED